MSAAGAPGGPAFTPAATSPGKVVYSILARDCKTNSFAPYSHDVYMTPEDAMNGILRIAGSAEMFAGDLKDYSGAVATMKKGDEFFHLTSNSGQPTMVRYKVDSGPVALYEYGIMNEPMEMAMYRYKMMTASKPEEKKKNVWTLAQCCRPGPRRGTVYLPMEAKIEAYSKEEAEDLAMEMALRTFEEIHNGESNERHRCMSWRNAVIIGQFVRFLPERFVAKARKWADDRKNSPENLLATMMIAGDGDESKCDPSMLTLIGYIDRWFGDRHNAIRCFTLAANQGYPLAMTNLRDLDIDADKWSDELTRLGYESNNYHIA